MGYIIIVIIAITYMITWNKYYIGRHQSGEKTSFNGYIHWIMNNFKNTPKDEYESSAEYVEEERTTQEARKGSAAPGSDSHYEQWKAQQQKKD